MLLPPTHRRLLPYLLHYLANWREFLLVTPQEVSEERVQPLDAAVQAYLRSYTPHPLFDHPVVVWWSDADHALLIPCALRGDDHCPAGDAPVFRLVRTKPPAHSLEQAASFS